MKFTARAAAWVLALSAVATVSAEDRPSAPAKSTAVPLSTDVPLLILNWDGVQDLIASHKGKVVVVDLWSTSCPPCIREFPNLVQLHRTHAKDVTCISVNLNYAGLKDQPPESLREDVAAFLKKQGATFPNVICSTPDLDLLEKIDLASIPAVYVYDRGGKFVKRFDNDELQSDQDEFTYANDVLPLVARLIGHK